jgi:hypothetical protein
MRGIGTSHKDNLLKQKELDKKQEEAIQSLRERVAQMKSKLESVAAPRQAPALNA